MNLPAKCALCEGSHPAIYQGCPIHKKSSTGINQKKSTKSEKPQEKPFPHIPMLNDTLLNIIIHIYPNLIYRARIFMQKLLLNMHIFMHTKIQKYAKNMQKKIYCV
jgi:hypothetical protein